jgi:tetrapyrrole methylase family protein/MazG family protein
MKRHPRHSPFNRFLSIVRKLRKECPWDRQQTHRSIRHSLLEETHEVLEAIDRRDMEELKRELGDLLLHVALHAVMAEERGSFTMNDILRTISEKLVYRHPHVFGRLKVRLAREVKANWEHLKLAEGRSSVLDGVPRTLPALLKARRLQEKASKVGFDWTDKRAVWRKVEEELAELRAAEIRRSVKRIEEEFGDVLFSLVNYSRFIGVHPELALQRASAKFSRRFLRVEGKLRRRGISPARAGLTLMDTLWTKEKARKR